MKYFSAMENVDGEMRERRVWGIEFVTTGQLYVVGFDHQAIRQHFDMLSRVIGSDAARIIELKVVR